MVRHVHSSFTTASVAHDGTADSLCPALLMHTSFLRSPKCIIRVDGAIGFQSLCNDLSLQQYGIELDFGYTKNKNVNSVIDKGIQELETAHIHLIYTYYSLNSVLKRPDKF